VNLANDTWVSDGQFSLMALDMVRFRAIEQRRWLVRASTWGPSAVVDPAGRLTAATEMNARGVVCGAIQPLAATTVYARAGDAFAVACVLAVALALMRSARSHRPPAPRDVTTRA
jgi:apolipoprotein N-acyltransferase